MISLSASGTENKYDMSSSEIRRQYHEHATKDTTYYVREYIIPGVVFFYLAYWAIKNLVIPVIRDPLILAVESIDKSKKADDSKSEADVPNHEKVE